MRTKKTITNEFSCDRKGCSFGESVEVCPSVIETPSQPRTARDDDGDYEIRQQGWRSFGRGMWCPGCVASYEHWYETGARGDGSGVETPSLPRTDEVEDDI